MSQLSGIYHHVYLWLREDGEPGDAHTVSEAAHKFLADIPGVLSVLVAAPAGPTLPAVDSSYSLVLLLEFTDVAIIESYETHPQHVAFVEACKPLFSRVQVYNSAPFVA